MKSKTITVNINVNLLLLSTAFFIVVCSKVNSNLRRLSFEMIVGEESRVSGEREGGRDH